MIFPNANRVIFSNNPLRSVICQCRFPPILTIDTETPAKYQERVRKFFPKYEEFNENEEISLPENIVSILPKDLLDSFPLRRNRRYQFKSKDDSWNVSLTKDFIALEAKNYVRWEEFRLNMHVALKALLDVYEPAYFIRIGLRYQNIIDRSNLGLDSTGWQELITSFIIGPLAEESTMFNIEENHGVFSLRWNDKGDFVRVRHGLGSDTGDEPRTQKYLLDNDIFTDEEHPAEVNNVLSKLDSYNSFNRDIFNWCITNRLRTAMGPETP